MHPVIIESLEEYLVGGLRPAVQREFEAHLNTCRTCREEVQGIQQISHCFSSLRAVETPEPSASFVTRVMRQVQGQAGAGSFWSLFSLDSGFGRRVAFASLLTLAVLGSFLVSREVDYAPGPVTPQAVIASDDIPSDSGAYMDRDRMLVTLTSYEP